MGGRDITIGEDELNSLQETTCRRFLLGIAEEEETSRVEGAVLAGELDSVFLSDAEDALIDDYLLGNMTHEERHGFATQFLLTEERRQRLAFATALIECARKQPSEELSVSREIASHGSTRVLLFWRRTALLAGVASLLLVALAGFQQLQVRRQRQIASAASDELTRLRTALNFGNDATVQPGVRPSVSLDNSQIGLDEMSQMKLAPSTRSVNLPPLEIPAHSQFVRIDMKLSLPLATKYREVMVASNGQPLWTQEFPASILPATKESSIVLPASILPSGTYHLRLETASAGDRFEESGDWVFQVTKE